MDDRIVIANIIDYRMGIAEFMGKRICMTDIIN